MSDFKIRTVEKDDWASLFRLLGGNNTGIPENDARHPAFEAASLIADAMLPEPRGRAWLAITPDGNAVGLTTTKNFSGGVFIDPAYRRQGIAEALITAREDYQRERGDTSAEASILATNMTSRRLFEKLGYRYDEASLAALAQNFDPDQPPLLKLVKDLRAVAPVLAQKLDL